ncbi:hypothetical protein NUM3379_22110 [Kineococcus sp. NUM-3379]
MVRRTPVRRSAKGAVSRAPATPRDQPGAQHSSLVARARALRDRAILRNGAGQATSTDERTVAAAVRRPPAHPVLLPGPVHRPPPIASRSPSAPLTDDFRYVPGSDQA